MQTLILNADYLPMRCSPLSFISWEEAIKRQFLEKMHVIEEYEFIARSPSIELFIPSVMVCEKMHVRKNRLIAFSKEALFLRDLFRCGYCGQSFHRRNHQLTLDHIKPRKHGGKNVWENYMTSCKQCNSKKGAKTSGWIPMFEAYRPTTMDLEAKARKLPIEVPHESWVKYLSQWEGEVTVSPHRPVFQLKR